MVFPCGLRFLSVASGWTTFPERFNHNSSETYRLILHLHFWNQKRQKAASSCNTFWFVNMTVSAVELSGVQAYLTSCCLLSSRLPQRTMFSFRHVCLLEEQNTFMSWVIVIFVLFENLFGELNHFSFWYKGNLLGSLYVDVLVVCLLSTV